MEREGWCKREIAKDWGETHTHTNTHTPHTHTHAHMRGKMGLHVT